MFIPRDDISEQSRAVHEAGHAVVGAQIGAAIIKADILQKGDQLGSTIYEEPESPLRNIALCVAGGLAEYIHRGRRGDQFGAISISDLCCAEKALDELHGANRPSWRKCRGIQEGAEVAMKLLCANWGAVLRIAEWLTIKKTITGRLVHAIIASHQAAEHED